MGKLIKLLLNERNVPEYTSIDGLKYVKYSNKVNLLRILLMIETLTDVKKFPTGQKILKILSTDTDQEILKELKALVKLYTPVVTALKKGKKASEIKILKEKFYKKFFPILLSNLNINLNSLTLASVFAKSKQGMLNKAQIKYILKLIKAIQEKELTKKDKQELLLIKSSLENKIEDNVSKNNEPNEIEKSKETKKDSTSNSSRSLKDIAVENIEKKFETKPTKELLELAEKFDTEINTITSEKIKKEAEQLTLEQEFETDIISVNEYIKSKFMPIKKNQKISKKIIEIQTKLQEQLLSISFSSNKKKDDKIKKIIASIIIELVETLSNRLPDFINNSNLEPNITFIDEMNIMIEVSDPNKSIEDFNYAYSLILNSNDDIDTINCEYFVLPPEAQNSGISKELIADSLRLYKAAGIKKIDLHANISLGGYVWLRYGFRPYPENIENIKEAFISISKAIRFGLKNKTIRGVTTNMAIEGLIKHFKGTGLDLYLSELKNEYNDLSEKIKNIADELDLIDDYGEVKIKLNTPINEIIADQFEIAGKKMSETFEINLNTLADDIALKTYDITFNKKIKMELDFSGRFKSLPKRLHQIELEKINRILKKEINSSIKINKKGIATWTIELSSNKAKIPVKKWFTISGITIGDKKLQPFPAGDDLTGEPWSLNWYGYLDLNDPAQYNRALEYATIK